MTPAFPIITACYAAFLGLLGAALTVNVIVNRVRSGVDAGDGGVARLAQAVRAHANFAEHVPLALILIAIVEALGVRLPVIYALGPGLVAARILSAWGLNTTLGRSVGRQAGAVLTGLVTVAASVLILYTAIGAR